MSVLKSSCPDTDFYCLRCGGDRCLNCVAAFPNTSGVCIAVNTSISNCIEYSDSYTCKICQYGYYVSNGQCAAITLENCIQLDENGNCRMCRD